MEDYSYRIAKAGLQIGAIKLSPSEPFRWASGYLMPIYNDNRKFLFHPKYREMILDGFESLIGPADVIAGTCTAGIPWGFGLASRLNMPFVYIRDKPKQHGLKNQVEGADELNMRRVVVIEDLVSRGGSSARAVEAVRNVNGTVNQCLTIFSYGFKEASEKFDEINCQLQTLLTYSQLMKVADKDYFNREQLKILEQWQQNPFSKK